MRRPTPPCKTGNWPADDAALKRPGSLRIGFDPGMNFDAVPTGRRGRPQTCSAPPSGPASPSRCCSASPCAIDRVRKDMRKLPIGFDRGRSPLCRRRWCGRFGFARRAFICASAFSKTHLTNLTFTSVPCLAAWSIPRAGAPTGPWGPARWNRVAIRRAVRAPASAAGSRATGR